jgi:hypothetical protein
MHVPANRQTQFFFFPKFFGKIRVQGVIFSKIKDKGGARAETFGRAPRLRKKPTITELK